LPPDESSLYNKTTEQNPHENHPLTPTPF
jgi:hypothetical protein